MTAQCGQYARATPYFAIRPALRRLAGLTSDEDGDVAADRLREWVEAVAPDPAVSFIVPEKVNVPGFCNRNAEPVPSGTLASSIVPDPVIIPMVSALPLKSMKTRSISSPR